MLSLQAHIVVRFSQFFVMSLFLFQRQSSHQTDKEMKQRLPP